MLYKEIKKGSKIIPSLASIGEAGHPYLPQYKQITRRRLFGHQEKSPGFFQRLRRRAADDTSDQGHETESSGSSTDAVVGLPDDFNFN